MDLRWCPSALYETKIVTWGNRKFGSRQVEGQIFRLDRIVEHPAMRKSVLVTQL